MRRFIGPLLVLAAALPAFAQTSVAQGMARSGSVVIPQSSLERPEDIGIRSRTNIMLKVVQGSPEQGTLQSKPAAVGLPPFPGYAYETPASLGCVYRLVSFVAGCNPNAVTENPSGGSRTIAIVDAYDDPDAAGDLIAFSSQFGLPSVTKAGFRVVYASGSEPSQDPTGGWEAEESLDIEMVHAMAPGANIILVEAASDLNTDLYSAVALASTLVEDAGGGEVSMGWGSSEFAGETSYDSVFTTPGVVYVAASGDGPGTEYPSVSPNVIAAGGTTVRRRYLTGDLKGQSAWQETGGGPSLYEPHPGFQITINHAFRAVPDLSFDSDPDTGVWIYDSIPISGLTSVGSNWYIFGGTSVATPSLAGIINVSGHFSSSSSLELSRIYKHETFRADYRDITVGNCGPYDSFSAMVGWDYCSGVGVPFGYGGK